MRSLGQSPYNGMNALTRRECWRTGQHFPMRTRARAHTHSHKEVIWAHSKVVATYKPREKASELNRPCQTLSFRRSSLPNSEEIIFCCLNLRAYDSPGRRKGRKEGRVSRLERKMTFLHRWCDPVQKVVGHQINVQKINSISILWKQCKK